jgi:hypothetical protein
LLEGFKNAETIVPVEYERIGKNGRLFTLKKTTYLNRNSSNNNLTGKPARLILTVSNIPE